MHHGTSQKGCHLSVSKMTDDRHNAVTPNHKDFKGFVIDIHNLIDTAEAMSTRGMLKLDGQLSISTDNNRALNKFQI